MASLPAVNSQLLIVDVDQHPLEDDVHVERLARYVLEVPGDLARLRGFRASVEFV